MRDGVKTRERSSVVRTLGGGVVQSMKRGERGR